MFTGTVAKVLLAKLIVFYVSLVFQRWISCSADFANSQAPVKRLFGNIFAFITDKVHIGLAFTQTVYVYIKHLEHYDHTSQDHTQ